MSTDLKSKSDISIVLFFFTALAVLGVAGGGYVVHDYARARASITWPEVDGIVLSQLADTRSRVRYVYSMDGRSYESTRERVFLSSVFHLRSGDYRAGEAVAVYVNPQDYDYAVLKPGGASVAFVLFSLISGFSIFFGVGGVVWALQQSAEEELEFSEEVL